jgi:cell division protein ZapA (FtsZ GTPase activity inhibitor)
LKIKVDIMKNTYKLLIFDDQYSIVSDEPAMQINKAASMIDTCMRDIAAKLSHVDEKRVAVLVALQMASRILALESQLEGVSDHQKKLIDRIETECLAVLRR